MRMMKINSESTFVVICAAGSSTRMGLGTKKEYLPLGKNNITVLSQSVFIFIETLNPKSIIITVPQNGTEEAQKHLFCDERIINFKNRIIFTQGGSTRQSSVLNALEEINKQNPTENSIVLIHDGARPFVTSQIILDVAQTAFNKGASVPGITPSDTQKEITETNTIKRHLIRSNLTSVQTPQGFNFNTLLKCHRFAQKQNLECTDDTEIWDSFEEITAGRKVVVVKGSNVNKKITYKEDIQISTKESKMIRVGIGTDLHKLAESRNLYLGGVHIPFSKGEVAHSDGDVLLHAISDSLLGASGLGDIGSYFPDEDPKWKNADSKILLKTIWDDVKKQGWNLGNLDCVIEIEKPKFLPWRNQVIKSIADILEVPEERIFVKAKTNEGLESVGQNLAVKVYAVCLLEK